MRAHIDDERCKGHGVCCALCPEVFELTDGGYARVLQPEVPAEHHDAVHAAATQCPEGAITLQE